MKMRDIQQPMLKLIEDAAEAEALLAEKDSQFFRRAYIRSVFASIEGITWLIKQVCLKAQSPKGPRRISLAEYALLSDQTYELKNNGEPSVQTKFLKLADNLRFTAKVVARLFGITLELGVGTITWEKFVKAISVRNRITHPKAAEEMTISDEDISLCKDVSGWFNDLVHSFMQGVLTASAAATKPTAADRMPRVSEP